MPLQRMPISLLALHTLALVAVAGCQQLEQDLTGGSGSGGDDAGAYGSVCVGAGSGADGLACCQEDGACTADYECCGGLCSSGACTSSGNTGCTAALGSRCTSASLCACTTSDDCCQESTGAVCDQSAVTTAGKRCCLTTGTPCGGDGDCCSGSCDATSVTCD